MKKYIIICLLSLVSLLSFGQRTNQAYWTYIDKYKDWAIEQMHQYGIPASITLAQGLLESNAGRSSLATQANNHFGIKVGGSWTGPYIVKSDDHPNDRFRKYKSANDSYIDHSKFLQQRRYQGLYRLSKTDYKGWARGLKAAGYATSPTYAESLIRVIEMYSLHQFDTGKYRSARPTTAPSQTAATATPVDEFFRRHIVYQGNKNYFIIVEIGDDMATISKMTASKEFKKNPIHIVEVNQSLHDISQLYGIRLESLCKLNGWEEPQAVQVGEILRIR